MGAYSRCFKKSLLLTKNFFLLLFLAVVFLATVCPFVVLRIGKDSWMDFFLECLPFFIPSFFLSGWCLQFVSSSFPTSMLFEIVYYSLWAVVVVGAILALKNRHIWKYVPYLFFTVDALVNFIVPHFAAAVDIAMILLFALMLKKTQGGEWFSNLPKTW